VPIGRMPSGGGELFVLGQEIVQAGDNVHAAPNRLQNDFPPSGRDLSARWSDSDQQGIGLRSLLERPDELQAMSDIEQLGDLLSLYGPIQHRHHFVRTVADHAAGCFGCMRIAVPFGQYDDFAVHRQAAYRELVRMSRHSTEAAIGNTRRGRR
jgi:hypothetical protein